MHFNKTLIVTKDWDMGAEAHTLSGHASRTPGLHTGSRVHLAFCVLRRALGLAQH